jgi:TP901 family phage tail tape measure protein
MATQGGGKSENQAKIELLYVSEGYKKSVQELQSLLDLVDKLKGDLGKVTMPAIKGLKGALREAGELNKAIESLVRQGSVAAVKPLREGATLAEKTAHAEALKVQVSNTVLRQAQLDVGERTLRTQRQLANEAQNELHRKAFLGELTKEEIKKHEKNIDYLKAINNGLEESAKAGKPQVALQNQVTKLIQNDITARKKKAAEDRQLETQTRLEKNKVALKFARQSLKEGHNKDLTKYLKTANLDQVKALESAMRKYTLIDGYAPTAHSKAFNKAVASARTRITTPKVDLKASDIVQKIAAGKFEQAEVNHAIAQLRKELTHATNTGADRKTLVDLHEGLINVKKAAAKKFTPQSPYQVAKGLEETKAEQVLTNRLNATSIATATKAQIQEQLKASEVMGHKTKAPFGSKEYDQEKAYQDLLKGRLAILKQQEVEEKKKDALAKVRSENQLSRIKSEMRATEDVRQLKILQRQLATRIAAEFKADPKSTVLPFAEGIKAQIAEKIKSVSTPKEISDLNRQAQDLKINNADTIAKNRQTAADKAAQRALDNEAKTKAITDGRFKTEQQITDLKQHELKFAKDTLNFGIQTGKLKGQERLDAEKHLGVIKQREAHEAKISQHNQNIRNLSLTHYKNENDLKGLKRAELEIAQKVIAYRIRNGQLTKEEAIAQQELYNAAKRRDHLLTAQAHRQDKERQNERRLNQITHLEGDGGASMAIVQAGFMMRSQVLGGLSSIFSGAFDSAIQLDKAFRNLQAISASTNYEMATMKVNLINVAQASKFSASEVGETAVMLAQAGLSIQEIGASMKGIITLAQATGTDLAKSVDVVTSVLSIFNKSATETDTIVNQLTAALNESKLDINKMALGLQYAGNIASDSGVSFEELTAALGATANAGIRSGSTLGTGLRQMFIDLQKPNEKLTKRLETLGITLDQVSFRSQGLEGVLRNLRNAGFSSADAFETFEVRSAAAFSALSGNLTDFHDLQEELADTNAAFEANNVQMESFAVQIDHLKSNLGILAAEGLKPTLSLLRDMTKGMAHAMQNAEEGGAIVKILVGAFAALMTAVTVTWFTKLAWEVGKLALSFAGLRAGLSLTGFGIAGLVAGIGVGVASFIAYNSELDRLNTKLDESKGKHNDLKASVQSTESSLSNIDGAVKNLIDRYGVLTTDTRQTESVAKSLMGQFQELGLAIEDVADVSADKLLSKLTELRTKLAQTLLEKNYLKGEAALIELDDSVEAATVRLNDKNPKYKDYVEFSEIKTLAQSKVTTDETVKGRLSKDEYLELVQKTGDYLRAVTQVESTREKMPLETFHPSQESFQLTDIIGRLKDPELRRRLRDLKDSITQRLDDVYTVIEAPLERERLIKKTSKKAFKIRAEELANRPDQLIGVSDNLLKDFNLEVETTSKSSLGHTEKVKKLGGIAERYLKEATGYIDIAKKSLASYKAKNGEDDITDEISRQIGEAEENLGRYRKLKLENDFKTRKIELENLQFKLNAANEAVKEDEKLLQLSTGLNTLENRKSKLDESVLARDDIRREMAQLKLKDNPEQESSLKFLEQQFETENRQRGLDYQGLEKNITNNANTAANTNLNTADKARLDAKKKDLDAFYKDIKNREKTLEGRQEAERFQATAKMYRPLTTGNMFDQLNTEDKKAAQAKANATGVSQEYSVFGQAKAAFSRQAARFDNESLQKKQVQEKLALETAILFDLQQRKQNLGIEEYNKLKAEQITLEAEVTRLNNIAADARADKHPEDLKLAQEALQRNKDAIAYHREAEEKLTQDIEARSNTINNLKDNLQALIDKYDLLDTTMSAGVQSMTSGLSSIFSDWASGVIQNTEDVRDAFEALGKSVLQSMAKVVSDRIAQQFMGFLLNGLGSMFGAPKAAPISGLGVETPSLQIGAYASTGGMATPSGVKHFANGGPVGGTYIGRDSVPAYLDPREYVVQGSAVEALGVPFMQAINNVTTGSLKQGAANLGGSKPMVQNVMKSSPPVNVYVVSPEQQRQMSQQDVVVALQDDILRGGATKKLIKAVITGEI